MVRPMKLVVLSYNRIYGKGPAKLMYLDSKFYCCGTTGGAIKLYIHILDISPKNKFCDLLVV